MEDLCKLLMTKQDPHFVHSTLWSKAIPQYNLGYEKFKKNIIQLEQKYSNLYFCGNYCGGISVPDTVNNSCMIAENILKR